MGIALEDIESQISDAFLVARNTIRTLMQEARDIVIMYKESEIPIQKFFSLITDDSSGSGSLLQKEISYEEVPIYSYHNNVPVAMIMGVRRITTITIGNIILEKKGLASASASL